MISETDDFGRTTKVTTKVNDVTKYSANYTYKYVGSSNRTTNNVDEMTYELGDDTEVAKYKYTYDGNNNVKSLRVNSELVTKYYYDSLNQLTDVADKSTDRYDIYYYDHAGNITRKQEHSLEHNGWCPDEYLDTIYYEYSDTRWGDLLTKYDGQSLTYDTIGNPLNYRDGMTMYWNGRELQSISKTGNSYSFTYNINGLRTKKSVNGTNTFYYYDDSNNLIGLKKGNTTVLFFYDSDGGLVSMSVGDDSYLFVKNLQGDIVKIIDEDSNVLATYSYDAWGKVYTETEDSSIAGLNPFRYRGYVYDPDR